MTPALLKQVGEALYIAEDNFGGLVLAFCGDKTERADACRTLRKKMADAYAALTAYTTLSEYDKAIHALAAVLDGGGWFAWCPEQGPMFYEEEPFIQEANESWVACWRSHGVEYEISEPITVPRPQDWRASLRRIRSGCVEATP